MWQLETDVDKASQVSLALAADGDRTRVILVPNDFWRMPEGASGHGRRRWRGRRLGSGLKHFANFAAT